MKKSIKVQPKQRGRPATGKDPLLTVRAPRAIIQAIEGWAAKNQMTRSAAVRCLVELGLKAEIKKLTGNVSSERNPWTDRAPATVLRRVKTEAKPTAKPGRRLRAQELATKAIEKI